MAKAVIKGTTADRQPTCNVKGHRPNRWCMRRMTFALRFWNRTRILLARSDFARQLPIIHDGAATYKRNMSVNSDVGTEDPTIAPIASVVRIVAPASQSVDGKTNKYNIKQKIKIGVLRRTHHPHELPVLYFHPGRVLDPSEKNQAT